MSSNQSIETRLVFFGYGDGDHSFKELFRSASKVSWKGTFGTSFNTDLKGGKPVIVRRLKDGGSSEIEFKVRVHEIGLLHHENLLPLRAYCFHHNEGYLDIELQRIIHLLGKSDVGLFMASLKLFYISTQMAQKFAMEIYDHQMFSTDSLDARLSEFGMVRLVSPDYKPKLIGGYRAPEVRNAQEVSHKSDVYSFGVLLLELLTGKAPLGASTTTTGVELPKWVRTMFREKPILDVFDSEFVLQYQEFGGQMVQILELAVCCTFQQPNRRPSMVAVLNQLRETCRFLCSD
ncbi:hypothetical protein ACH5RR_029912 [Cinchona calisaya]|uniref:Protein kinase domain-containing protein n=1 Tax=Cinchona calisaya TaxID=153742 RepID=A0ABD2YUH8_9GENT